MSAGMPATLFQMGKNSTEKYFFSRSKRYPRKRLIKEWALFSRC